MRYVGVLLAVLVACSEPGVEQLAPSPTPHGMEVPPPTPARLETLESAFDAIDCTKRDSTIGTGGNPGLRDFGVCYVGEHNIDIYLVSDQSWEYILEQFPGVAGPGWVIVTPTGEEAARYVHGKVGGDIYPVKLRDSP